MAQSGCLVRHFARPGTFNPRVKVSPRLADGRTVLALLTCLAVGSAAGLAGGLVATSRSTDGSSRPLSVREAHQLAGMRLANYQEARAGIFAVLGPAGAETYLTGWIDWRRQLVYAAVSGPGAPDAHRLLQAVPGVVAERPQQPGGRPPTTDTGRPPANPPPDGWRIRASAAGNPDRPLDSLLALLLTLAANAPDSRDALLDTDARWLGEAQVGGTDVDVIVGPAAFPTVAPLGQPASPRSVSTMGGAVRYFVDDRSRLHRFDLVLPGGLPARVDIDRADRPLLVGIDAFGGRPAQPRPLTAAEAALLAGIGLPNAAGGAAVDMALPAPPVADLTARGWVSRSQGVVYLAVQPAGRPGDALLIRADRGGVAATPLSSAPGTGPAVPPLPLPGDRGWTYRPWDRRPGTTDLDLLLSELLWLASSERDDVTTVRAATTWLRSDRLAGVRVSVFEVVRPGDRVSGDTRIRYWVDSSGTVRRVEARTSVGTFARADLAAAVVPAIPAVPTT
jgi:hypothetical protein